MKNILYLLLILILPSLRAIPQNSDFVRLKKEHIAHMRYYGHIPFFLKQQGQLIKTTCNGHLTCAFIGKNIAIGYMETGKSKVYWVIEKIKGGVNVSFKLNIKRIVYSFRFRILYSRLNIHMKFLEKPDNSLQYDSSCVMGKALRGTSCKQNLYCWLRLMASVINCCQLP